MIIVLLFSMITINLLILINKLNKEGFEEDTDKKVEKKKVKKKDKKIPEEIDESGELFNKGKLEETKYPDSSDDSIKKKMNKLGSLSKSLDGLNISEINKIINKLSTVMENF